jgi:hypothetical protein
MMTSICLRVIEGLRRPNHPLALSIMLAAHHSGDLQPLGLNLKLRRCGSLRLGLTANQILYRRECDPPRGLA